MLKKVNEYPSSSIILNASNEVLAQKPNICLKTLICHTINTLNKILRDRNYRKYVNFKDLKQIIKINFGQLKESFLKINETYGLLKYFLLN